MTATPTNSEKKLKSLGVWDYQLAHPYRGPQRMKRQPRTGAHCGLAYSQTATDSLVLPIAPHTCTPVGHPAKLLASPFVPPCGVQSQ
eukprot:6492783-Amphidinium_carterae.2